MLVRLGNNIGSILDAEMKKYGSGVTSLQVTLRLRSG